MSAPFVAGLVAGYAIAVPVGAIAVLILDRAIRRGFRVGVAAGAGAATVDSLYATMAAFAGSAVAPLIAPVEEPFRIIAAVVLAAIGVHGLVGALGARTRATALDDPLVSATGVTHRRGEIRAVYARFVGLTIVNPATVVYFAALVVGLPAIGTDPAHRAAFVVGVGLASLSWQTTLAGIGSLAHGRLSPGARVATGVVGNLIVLALAANIARTAFPG